MPNAERRKTGLLTCNHCGNYAEMDIVANYYRSAKPIDDDEYSSIRPDEGYQYELLLCLSCKEVTLWKYFDAEYLNPEEIEIETLYPLTRSKLLGLPYRIQHVYEISLKVRAIDANAYAVLLGRILEMVCEDRQAEGKDLHEKLKDLSTKREIPERLESVAHSLRKLRNVGAHNSAVQLTKDEVPILDDLCSAILEYLYGIPYLIDKAEQQLKRLKEKDQDQSKTSG